MTRVKPNWAGYSGAARQRHSHRPDRPARPGEISPVGPGPAGGRAETFGRVGSAKSALVRARLLWHTQRERRVAKKHASSSLVPPVLGVRQEEKLHLMCALT